jgi:hypothetical protein
MTRSVSLYSVALLSLWTTIAADGQITEEEVNQLENKIDEDGVISLEKSNTIFKIQNGLNSKGEYASVVFESLETREIFDNMCATRIVDYLSASDEATPTIDAEESEWLKTQIQSDGKYSDWEQRLADALLDSGINFDSEFGTWLETVSGQVEDDAAEAAAS